MTGGYLDAAAGLPWHPVAVAAWQAALDEGWADPLRPTGPGRRAAVLLDAARAAIAAEFGVQPDELVFAPSGSHALRHAMLGSLAGRHRAGNRLVHSAVEHSTVLRVAERHRRDGGSVTEVPVDAEGRVDEHEFVAAAGVAGVATAVLQAANHEVGSRQPVGEVLQALAGSGVPLVVDASHEVVYGELPAAPIVTADARLWGGPAGVGLLVLRRGVRWQPPEPVDEAEAGRALGAPSVPAAVAAAAALRATRADRAVEAARLSGYVDQLRRRIPELVPDTVVLGAEHDRLPHLVTFSCLYLDGQALLTELDRRGFTASSGSSCSSDSLTPSHVLVAMGALTGGNVRLSLHPGVTQSDLDRFLELLPAAVAEVRAAAPGSPPATPPGRERTPAAPETTAPVLDSRGRRCPLPVLDLARALPELPVGGELVLLADDPAASGDIAAWCRMTGQQLVGGEPDSGFRVRRLH